jgi:hypothetical protein
MFNNDNFKHEQFPHIPENLINALDKAFPYNLPNTLRQRASHLHARWSAPGD